MVKPKLEPKPKPKSKRKHYHVYVVELSKDVLLNARFMRSNPNYLPDKNRAYHAGTVQWPPRLRSGMRWR